MDLGEVPLDGTGGFFSEEDSGLALAWFLMGGMTCLLLTLSFNKPNKAGSLAFWGSALHGTVQTP